MTEADGVKAQVEVIMVDLEAAQKLILQAMEKLDAVEGGIILLQFNTSVASMHGLSLVAPDAHRAASESFAVTEQIAESLLILRDSL